jgi:hypothetical protein
LTLLFILQNWKFEANIYISLGVLLGTKWENLHEHCDAGEETEQCQKAEGEKKKRKNLQAAGRGSIKGKKERISHFAIVQNPMCGLIHTHASFAFALPSIP